MYQVALLSSILFRKTIQQLDIRPMHYGFPCKHGITALVKAENDRSLHTFQAHVHHLNCNWYDNVYHVETLKSQYNYQQPLNIPEYKTLMEINLWPATI